MTDDDFHLEFEEQFHKGDKKIHRKERKLARQKDRSQYKKTDQEKKKQPIEKEIENSLEGRVISITSEGFFVQAGEQLFICSIKGTLKQRQNREKNLVAVGDLVDFQALPENQGTIYQVKPRKSILARAENYSRKKKQIIATNVEQVLITTSTFNPSFKHTLIDRYIIMAQKGNMTPIIIINKSDYLHEIPEKTTLEEWERIKTIIEECLSCYQSLSIPIILLSAKTGEGIDTLLKLMQNKISVFSGQSGVGKTSLINMVIGTNLKTAEIKMKTQKGKHTTTIASLLPLPQGGYCVDTPGIKSFGLWDIQLTELPRYFPDIQHYAPQCKFPNCTHIHEPGCFVKDAVEEEKISPLRYSSYLALYEDIKENHTLF